MARPKLVLGEMKQRIPAKATTIQDMLNSKCNDIEEYIDILKQAVVAEQQKTKIANKNYLSTLDELEGIKKEIALLKGETPNAEETH